MNINLESSVSRNDLDRALRALCQRQSAGLSATQISSGKDVCPGDTNVQMGVPAQSPSKSSTICTILLEHIRNVFSNLNLILHCFI
jgi:hypothetical protein